MFNVARFWSRRFSGDAENVQYYMPYLNCRPRFDRLTVVVLSAKTNSFPIVER